MLRERRTVLPIVEAFVDAQAERESLDFADQMALAARLARRYPPWGRSSGSASGPCCSTSSRTRPRRSSRCCRPLFHDPRVALTAVGDPQPVDLRLAGRERDDPAALPAEFAAPDGPSRRPAAVDQLAQRRADPRRGQRHARPPRHGARAAAQRSLRRRSRRRHDRPLETAEAEATHVAQWVAARWRSPSGRRTGRSAAVLCRRRSSFPLVIEALREAGLPVEVVGLGGLLMTPEVSDLVAALWVVQDPTRGDQLMRLLSGPVVRLGAADLDGLWAWAKELHRRPWRIGHEPSAQGVLPLDPGVTLPDEPASDLTHTGGSDQAPAPRQTDLAPDSADAATLVEALDELPPLGWAGRGGARLSEEGPGDCIPRQE